MLDGVERITCIVATQHHIRVSRAYLFYGELILTRTYYRLVHIVHDLNI